VIVTLSGHVDHGKTTLVRLLTGTDTDRLAEEKRRGLTIDLGFAYLQAEHLTVGFVDVPGHHRFIHNMVAGIAAMQHALLVIAADDGPMPQSREHLQILELLGVSHGVIALSKCDRVSAARIAEARAEVRNLVAGTFLEHAPVIDTSAATGTGIEVLRSHLLHAAGEMSPADERQPFRMAVDRAFTLKGTGLVVTGTVHGGRVNLEDEVHVFPLGSTGRVRELRVQDQRSAGAGSGDRAAINLAGPVSDALKRGHWLCAQPDPGHRTLVLELKVLDDFPRDIRHWSPVHVYHATSHAAARMALLQGARLQAGERAWVELILDEPLLAKRGDRIVVRDHALERTLGGGTVIDNRPAMGRRRTPARLHGIEACAARTADAALGALLAQGPVHVQAFNGLWNLRPNDFDELLRQPAASRHGEWLISDGLWQQWNTALLDECRQRHAHDPALQGLRENDFAAPVPAQFRASVLGDLAAAGHLDRRAGRYSPRRHQAELSADEQNLLERLRPLLEATQPPSLGDLGRTLRIPLAELKAAVKVLASKGALVQVNDKRIYLPRHLAELAQTAEALSQRGPFSVAEYRDAAAVGRNVAIDVLEYFDARGFTRRQGETRTVTGERSRLQGKLG
jgi:selenocysteine-specific elongation factor